MRICVTVLFAGTIRGSMMKKAVKKFRGKGKVAPVPKHHAIMFNREH
jgi:hypothetical protein